MYAVVEINGKQYRAEQGKALTVDRMMWKPVSSLSFEKFSSSGTLGSRLQSLIEARV